jgi:hypothetical protein
VAQILQVAFNDIVDVIHQSYRDKPTGECTNDDMGN